MVPLGPLKELPSLAAPSEEDLAQLRRGLAQSVSRICPPWLASQADDIVQAAMMRLLAIFRKGERRERLEPSYLWRVAYSVTIDEIRRLRSRKEVPMDTMAETHEAILTPDPERVGYSREIGRDMQRCLLCVIKPRRVAVTLHLQGHSVQEAARLLGWTEKKVENLVYRGLADLRRCLRSKGLEP